MNLFGTPLSSRQFFALWVGIGTLGGLAIGTLLASGSAGLAFMPLWAILVSGYVGIILLLARRHGPDPTATASGASATAAPRAATASAAKPSGPLRIHVDLPEIPAGYPPVVGDKEEVLVRMRVTHDGQPAEGAAVRLQGTLRDGGRVVVKEGVTGTGGSVAFTFKPQGTGELMLEMQASLDALRGTASTTLGVVLYEEEIERLFGEFRAYAVGVLGPDSHSDTARELAERLRREADADTGRALLELARIYELVAYGERDADRRLYLALVGALLVLEGAPMPEATPEGLSVEG